MPTSTPDRQYVLELDGRIEAATVALADRQQAWKALLVEATEDVAEELLSEAKVLAKTGQQLRGLRAELAELAQDIERGEAWERRRQERKRLQAEARKLNTYFSDEQALQALTDAIGEGALGAASGATVAGKLAAAPTQSDRIRVGLALSRLARAGKVARLVARRREDRVAKFWSLPNVTVSESVTRTHRRRADYAPSYTRSSTHDEEAA